MAKNNLHLGLAPWRTCLQSLRPLTTQEFPPLASTLREAPAKPVVGIQFTEPVTFPMILKILIVISRPQGRGMENLCGLDDRAPVGYDEWKESRPPSDSQGLNMTE